MDLNALKLKTSTQLKEDEKEFLRQNVDKLNDEDKAAYSSFLTPLDDSGSGGGQPAAGAADLGAGDGGEGGEGAGSGDDGGSGGGNGEPTPTYSFKSEDEAKEFVRKELAEQEKQKQAAIDAAATPEEKKWVEENWKPKDWNEGIKTAAEAAADILEERQKERQKKVEEQGKRMEADWQALRKEHNLPDIKDKEGAKIHNQIVDVGVKHGKKNFKDAYDLWKIIPETEGGGYKVTPAAVDTKEAEKKTLSEQKRVAAQVGAQNQGAGTPGVGASPLKPLTYEEMKSKSKTRILKESL